MIKKLGYVATGFLLCLLITKQPFFNEKEIIEITLLKIQKNHRLVMLLILSA
ncbi:hypothetical protein [Pseudoalteromonas tunicata]|jgi:hypothetical protein|uniref:Uncharacterized protein n=1 Tax=Pseudoalteromonas tunicata D2 TaxID=87626 RepID=A4C3T3_9GAMM|nr:hypothetical protein [Pseudoalteromonas tunicata]ATC96507.1 hypothetical protein PTUN_b0033 [Pseudoalteromonas tunicata]EAR30215.1 hypothetical protein PTD2_01561 [Pseudoalteromonas tunicata D2]